MMTGTVALPPKSLRHWTDMAPRSREKALLEQAERPNPRVTEWLKAEGIREGALETLDRLAAREDARAVRQRERFAAMRADIESSHSDRVLPRDLRDRLVDEFLDLPTTEANRRVIDMAFHMGPARRRLMSDPDAARRAFVLAARLYRSVYGTAQESTLGQFCDELAGRFPELLDVPDDELDYTTRRAQ